MRVHPQVLLEISDHASRVRAAASPLGGGGGGGGYPNVQGVVCGAVGDDGALELFGTFEMPAESSPLKLSSHFSSRRERFKEMHAEQEVAAVYSLGAGVEPHDKELLCTVELSLSEGGDFETVQRDRKSTRLKSSHGYNSYAVFCFKKKNKG